MAAKGNERITVRLSQHDMNGLKKIKMSGEFDEVSSALRWCIHFTVAMLRVIPAAIIESFMITEATEENTQEISPNDTLERVTEEVPDTVQK